MQIEELTPGQIQDLREHDTALRERFRGVMPRGNPFAVPVPLNPIRAYPPETLRRWRHRLNAQTA